MRLVHEATGQELASSLEKPRTFVGRGLGLMFRRRLQPGAAMWIDPCSSIHMFFMRFAIDAVFVDRQLNVVKVVAGLKPWRMVPLAWGARSVFELEGGRLQAAGVNLGRGDRLRIETEAEAGRKPARPENTGLPSGARRESN